LGLQVQNAAQQGMGFNCGGGMFNSGGQSRSMHPGGVNVGFGDGSVRFIKNSISNAVWIIVLAKADGGILSSDQYWSKLRTAAYQKHLSRTTASPHLGPTLSSSSHSEYYDA
jgi:prepilin-type processing-associated H-X9-DG protein